MSVFITSDHFLSSLCLRIQESRCRGPHQIGVLYLTEHHVPAQGAGNIAAAQPLQLAPEQVSFIEGRALRHDTGVAVDVLPSHDRWFGMTYRQDRETVAAELRQLHDRGIYPRQLWD